jgi:hypothetical protein
MGNNNSSTGASTKSATKKQTPKKIEFQYPVWIESYGVATICRWLQENGFNEEEIKLIKELEIDGEGLLFIDENFFSLLQTKIKAPEIAEKLIKTLKSRQEEELKKVRDLEVTSKEKFDPREIPEEPKKAILYFHDETSHLEKRGNFT